MGVAAADDLNVAALRIAFAVFYRLALISRTKIVEHCQMSYKTY